MKRILSAATMFIMILSAAPQALTVICTSIKIGATPVKNMPVQLYFTGGLDRPMEDTVHNTQDNQLRWNKTASADSTGKFSITFHSVPRDNSAKTLGLNVIIGVGTVMKAESPLKYSFLIDDGSIVDDTLDLDNANGYIGFSKGSQIPDSIRTIGKVTASDGLSDSPVANASFKVTFTGGSSAADTVSISGTTSADGSIINVPVFFNKGLFRNAMISVSASGYIKFDSLFSCSGILWDGKTDTLNAKISLTAGSGPTPQDTVDTIEVRGTIKDSSGSAGITGATIKVSIGSDSLSYPDSKTVTSSAAGSYEAWFPNNGKLPKVFYKIEATATGYSAVTAKNSAIIAAPKDGKNDTVTVPLNLTANAAPGDTLVIRALIKDGLANVPVTHSLVQISCGIDTNSFVAVKTDSADANGGLSVIVANSLKINHVFCKVQAADKDYQPGTQMSDFMILSQDGKKDTVTVTLSLHKTPSPGDTLVVCGVITDSASSVKPAAGTTVSISLGADRTNFPVVMQCTTQTSGTYQIKLVNTVKALHIFGKIKAEKPSYGVAVKTSDITIVPDDYKNDTLMINVRISQATGNIAGLAMKTVAVRRSITIEVYTLTGRLVAAIASNGAALRSDMSAYFKSHTIRQNSYLVVSKEKNGKIHNKMMVYFQ
jgi:hypothetical protein